MPMRSPVNEPGPDATANRSIVGSGHAVRAERARASRPAAARRACAPRRRALVDARDRRRPARRFPRASSCPEPAHACVRLTGYVNVGDAGDASVSRRQAAASRRDPVVPHGRLLRDVLRGRARRGARARADADLAVEGRQRRRHPDVRRAVSRRRRLHRAAGEEGLPRRDLRSGRGSAQGQGHRQARGRARRLARHAHRRELPRRARAGVPDGGRARPTARQPIVGVALLDLSTGEFTAAEYAGADGCRRSPTSSPCCGRARSSCPATTAPTGRAAIAAGRRRSPACRSRRSTPGRSSSRRRGATLLDQLRAGGLEGFGLDGHPAAVAAAGALVHYLRDTQKVDLAHVRAIAYRQRADALLIDPTTLKHLEIVEGSEGGRDGSLLDELDRTVTSMGSRLLRVVAAAAARRARADPRSARRRRGARVPHHRARQVPRRDQGACRISSGWSRAPRSAPPVRAISSA